MQTREAALALKNGTIFKGNGFGATTEVSGEVVFSTGYAHYPESLTDPSLNGQILTLTTPQVGNYGVPSFGKKDKHGLPFYFESDSIKAEGLIVFECCKQPYHYSMERTLDKWLADENKPGIEGIDTRRLTKLLRVHGVMLGILKVAEPGEALDIDDLVKRAANVPDPNVTRDLVGEVSVKENKTFHGSKNPDKHPTVVLIDCGVKYNIIRSLLDRGLNVILAPRSLTWQEVQDIKPAGVIISNGPGDPKDCKAAIQTTRACIDNGMPTLGICLGNQIMGLAAGANTYKLKFGHRAANKPVIDVTSPEKRAYITSQNHGFCVDEKTLPDDMEVYFICADDKTVEGIRHKTKPAFAVQFHPEATPGPYDTDFLFDKFIHLLPA